MLETKCIKSGGKSQLSLSFLASIVNDVRRKLYAVGTHSTVEKRAKRMQDITVETTAIFIFFNLKTKTAKIFQIIPIYIFLCLGTQICGSTREVSDIFSKTTWGIYHLLDKISAVHLICWSKIFRPVDVLGSTN